MSFTKLFDRLDFFVIVLYLLALVVAFFISVSVSFSSFILQFLSIVILLLITLIVFKIVFHRVDILAPTIFYPIVYILYYSLGSWNISDLRGFIPTEIFKFVFLGLLFYYVGVFIGSYHWRWGKSRAIDTSTKWNGRLVLGITLLMFIIGVVATLQILFHGGSPLLQGTRFYQSPYLIYLSYYLWLGPIVLISYQFYVFKKIDFLSVLLFLLGLLGLFLLGYRSPIVMALIFLSVVYYYTKRPKNRTIIFAGIIAVIFGTLYYYLRNNIFGEAQQVQLLMKEYDFPSQLGWLFVPYLTARNGVALTYRIFGFKELLGGRLLIADLLTALPGKQIGGGEITANLLGGTGVGGLTISVLGGFYFDFGTLGICVGMAVLGLLGGIFYNRYKNHKTIPNLLLYSYIVTFLLHFLNRGVFGAVYVFQILSLFFVSSLLTWLSRQNAVKNRI